MKDVFGNYVVQKLIEFGSINNRDQLFNIILPITVELSEQEFSCRVV